MNSQTKYPHQPPHKFSTKGTYMVTAGTLHKKPFFNSSEKLDLLAETLFEQAEKYNWTLKSWAIFPNHYHFIASQNSDPKTLPELIRSIHAKSSMELNQMDNERGRKVWYQYWDTSLSFTTSFYARMNYVIQNPVKHGVVKDPLDYKWCSASWFYETAERQFQNTVFSFKCDKVSVIDDF